MPSRRRHRDQPFTPAAAAPSTGASDVERFAAALKDTARREREQRAAAEQRAASARAEAQQRADHAAALAAARLELRTAIAGVRSATGAAVAAAEAAWRTAKARVIELETGAPPSWAPAAAASVAEADDEVPGTEGAASPADAAEPSE
ncbi:MAG: hypothetical protein ACO3C1_00990 [Ilumatobacteraceae bacterium]